MNIVRKTQLEEETFFWNVIEKANKQEEEGWEYYDDDDHIDTIIDMLSKTDKDHLVIFEKVMQQKLHDLYTADIAELYIILLNDFNVDGDKIEFDDTISDDAFIYFRCWLLLRGEAFVKDIQANIENFVIGDYSFNIADCDGEELLYVTDLAYEEMMGIEESEEIRDIVYEQYQDIVNYDNEDGIMARQLHAGGNLLDVYPTLVGEICEIRLEVEEEDENNEDE